MIGICGATLPDALCNPVREIRAVDDDQHVGCGCDGGSRGLPDAPQQKSQAGYDRDDAHDRYVGHWEQAFEPGPFHGRAANTRNTAAGMRRLQLDDELRAQFIARGFACDDEDARCRAGVRPHRGRLNQL